MRTVFRFFVFIVTICIFFTLPLTILWNEEGFFIGLLISFSFLLLLYINANKIIATTLRFKKIFPAQHPKLFTLIEEFSRRLEIKRPAVGIIETNSINIAVFGFHSNNSFIAITSGMLKMLNEDELSAILCREITKIRFGGIMLDTFFSRFTSILSKIFAMVIGKKKNNWLYILVNQIVFYPIYIFTLSIFGIGKLESEIDKKSLYYSKLPISLYEALKKIQSYAEREPLFCDIFFDHLFCIPPCSNDLTRFRKSNNIRIEALQDLPLKA